MSTKSNFISDKRTRSIVRKLAKQTGTCYPVYIVEGNKSPQLEGCGYYYTTVSGKTIVRHPRAYGYRTKYHPSTKRIEVGVDWFCSFVDSFVDKNYD